MAVAPINHPLISERPVCMGHVDPFGPFEGRCNNLKHNDIAGTKEIASIGGMARIKVALTPLNGI